MSNPFEIRQSVQELQECFESIRAWEREVKGDIQVHTKEPMKENLRESEVQKQKQAVGKDNRIKSSDYSSWDRFDVDKALEQVDNEERDRLNIERANQYKEEGNKRFSKGDYHEAIIQYTRAIQIHQRNAVYYVNRAQCHLKLKQYEQAAEDCTKALSIDAGNVKGLWRRALAYRHMEIFDKSELDLQEAAKKDPTNSTIVQELKRARKLTEWRDIPVQVVDGNNPFPPEVLNSASNSNSGEPTTTTTATATISEIVQEQPANIVKELEQNEVQGEEGEKLNVLAPVSSIDFVRDWKTLVTLKQRHLYIKSIQDFSVLKKSLEPSHLSAFLEVLINYYHSQDMMGDGVRILKSLSETDRFSMNLMFIGKDLKLKLSDLLSKWEIGQEELNLLKKLYKC